MALFDCMPDILSYSVDSTFSAMLLPAVAIENDRKIMVDIMITNLSFIMISAICVV